jgi:hypothetical protein
VTRHSLDDYLRATSRSPGQCLFPGRRGPDAHLTTRRYARLVSEWVSGIGLDPLKYATHSMSAGQRRLSSIGGQGTSARCNFCLGTNA